MTILQELLVPLTLDSSKFEAGIDKAIGKSDSLLSGLSAIGGGIVTGALSTAAAGLTALGIGLFDSTKGAMDAEMIQADLNATIKSTGGVAGMTAKAINELAGSLSKVTMFEDDAIVKGDNMLLTFTNIGKDVFPQATEAMLNMAQKMGKEPVDMAVMLGKALNDPANGLSALTRNGVVFTEEQQKQIKAMQEAGDVAGAQKIILAELEKEFGGIAVAAGSTAQGGLTRFMHLIDGFKDQIGTAILPALTQLTNMLVDIFSKPAVVNGVAIFSQMVGDFASKVVSNIPVVIQWFSSLGEWLSNNQGVIVGVLSALGVAVIAFGISVATAAWTAMAPLLPVIAIMALVGVAAYALYEAWKNNFGGIQDKVKAVWDFLKPIFERIKEWFETNIPIAINKLKEFWENVLLPAMTKVYKWMEQYLFPLFRSIGEFLSTAFSLYITALAGLWENVLWPAIKKVMDWMKEHVMPILKPIGEFIGGALKIAFQGLSDIIAVVTASIDAMTRALQKIKLPSWLTPGSPTPFENGLVGINKAMSDLNRTTIPGFQASLNISSNPMNQPATTTNGLNEERLARLIVSALQQGG